MKKRGRRRGDSARSTGPGSTEGSGFARCAFHCSTTGSRSTGRRGMFGPDGTRTRAVIRLFKSVTTSRTPSQSGGDGGSRATGESPCADSAERVTARRWTAPRRPLSAGPITSRHTAGSGRAPVCLCRAGCRVFRPPAPRGFAVRPTTRTRRPPACVRSWSDCAVGQAPWQAGHPDRSVVARTGPLRFPGVTRTRRTGADG